jgi:hypothetical protein
MKIRLDLHVHTNRSHDCSVEPRSVIDYAKKVGLDGIAITDHDEAFEGIDHGGDILVIPGIEVSTKRGHLIALGTYQNVKRGLTVEETVEEVRDLGGITVIPHPYRVIHGIRPSLEENIGIDAIEVCNGKDSKRLNRKAEILAKRWGKAEVGGSDAHRLEEIGCAITILEVSEPKLDEVLKGIGAKKSRALLI